MSITQCTLSTLSLLVYAIVTLTHSHSGQLWDQDCRKESYIHTRAEVMHVCTYTAVHVVGKLAPQMMQDSPSIFHLVNLIELVSELVARSLSNGSTVLGMSCSARFWLTAA